MSASVPHRPRPRRQDLEPEPSWHRRHRKLRSQARLSVQVTAACLRLARLHGSQVPKILQHLVEKNTAANDSTALTPETNSSSQPLPAIVTSQGIPVHMDISEADASEFGVNEDGRHGTNDETQHQQSDYQAHVTLSSPFCNHESVSGVATSESARKMASSSSGVRSHAKPCNSSDDEEVCDVAPDAKNNDDLLHARIVRRLDGVDFDGVVRDIEQSSRTRQRLYLIEYADGDIEHMTRSDVHRCLAPKVTSHQSSVSVRRQCQATLCGPCGGRGCVFCRSGSA